jgi:hypothetical protein
MPPRGSAEKELRATSGRCALRARDRMQRAQANVLDVAPALPARAIEPVLQALQRFLHIGQFVLRGLVDATLQIVLDPLMPMLERSTPCQQHVLDSAEILCRGHTWLALAPAG